MKRFFSCFAVMLASVTIVMSLSIGVVTAVEANKVVQHQEVEVSSPVAVSAAEVLVASPVEESLKLCKDEQGNAKVCEDKDLLAHLLLSMGGLKGASALAIAFVISKFLLLFLLSPLFSNIFPSLLKGGVKLLVALGLNVVVGVLGLLVAEVPLSAAIVHSSTLAAFSLLGNQAYKQWLTKKGQA
jgi:hypothetical protein